MKRIELKHKIAGMRAFHPPWLQWKKQLTQQAVFMYMTGRAAVFTLEFETLDRFLGLFPQSQRVVRKGDRELKSRLAKEILELLKQDAALFADKIIPVDVLRPEHLSSHRHRLLKLIQDGRKLYRRRKNNENKTFGDLSSSELKSIPDYYLRNYHFQTDGYLSEESAELYDHQVDMLFSGTTDAMRRAWIRPFLSISPFQSSSPIRALDVACGTGSSTAVIRSVFPSADLTAIDLSPPYIQHCIKRFEKYENPPTFLTRDFRTSELTPESFDFVSCMFLFHELPREERAAVLTEIFRVVRPGGYAVIVDAVQKSPEEAWLNPLIEDFPINYHEPFFKDYAQTPLENLTAEVGFQCRQTGRAFMSRYWVLKKPN